MLSPTAQPRPADEIETPASVPVLIGVGTDRHLPPVKCRVIGLPSNPLKPPPTAQVLRPEDAPTPRRPFPSPPGKGFGLFTRIHLLPFQCKITVVVERLRSVVKPTAQALLVERAATPVRR